MGRQKAGKKAYQALDLLTGLYDPDIQGILARHGLGEAERERGWQLLRAYAESRRAAPARSTAETDERLKQLDAWENRWFVVSDAALLNAFPQAHEWLFRRLKRSSGFDVMVTTVVFVERLRKLEQGVAELGEQGPHARERLRQRGLTDDVVSEAEALIRLIQVPPDMRSAPERSIEKEAAAEQALWTWYIEWSGIARAVLPEKRLLNHIGFGKVGRPRKS